MHDNNSIDDVDDAKILAKFNSLLNKYQNQGRMNAVNTLTPGAAPMVEVNDCSPATDSDSIPILTEIVSLPSSNIPPQPPHAETIEHILNAALNDAHISLDTAEKKILASALDARLSDPSK
ncbi:MAG TPA: hypothetical protein VK141_09595 [Nitrosomonas sp.]|nr:hypothetical protein [Nitrosomonas sp.]